MSERKVYHRILDRAKEIVGDNQRLKNLLLNVGEKLSKVGDGSEQSVGFLGQLKLLIRMIRAHITGTYNGFAPITLIMFVFLHCFIL